MPLLIQARRTITCVSTRHAQTNEHVMTALELKRLMAPSCKQRIRRYWPIQIYHNKYDKLTSSKKCRINVCYPSVNSVTMATKSICQRNKYIFNK